MRACAAVGCGFAAVFALVATLEACGESRRPIGEECLRDEDCLSAVCAARSCVSAPTLISGAGGTVEETPHLPGDDAATQPSDASSDGS